jgi:hypothetical protein
MIEWLHNAERGITWQINEHQEAIRKDIASLMTEDDYKWWPVD